MQAKSRHGMCQRGGTLLESALVYGIFMFMLIATIDFGQLLFLHQTLTERARAAARYGVTKDYNSATITAMQNVVLFSNAAGNGDSTTGLFGLARSNVEITRTPGTYSLPATLTVRLRGYQFRFFTPLIAGVRTGADIIATLPMETP